MRGGAVDLAHAAVTDLIHNLIRADPRANAEGDTGRDIGGRMHEVGRGAAHKVAARLRAGLEQRIHFPVQFVVTGAGLVEECKAQGHLERLGFLEHSADLLPAFRSHAEAVRSSSR